VEQAKRLSDAFPDTSQYQVLLADAYRALGPRSRTATEEELSRRGLARERSALQNRTEEEEERNRLKSPEGQAALKENQAQAESIYQSVLKVNPQTAEAFRGLGYLYEEQGKYLEAIAQYRHYLDLVAGTSLDHLRIEHRLAALEKLNANAPLTTK
jgi:tetratricopeptide (TPR) repeat protein